MDDGVSFTTYWWYAWPSIPLFLVGFGLYRLRRDRVLTPAARQAQAHFEALA
jgi:hypothetical protein